MFLKFYALAFKYSASTALLLNVKFIKISNYAAGSRVHGRTYLHEVDDICFIYIIS